MYQSPQSLLEHTKSTVAASVCTMSAHVIAYSMGVCVSLCLSVRCSDSTVHRDADGPFGQQGIGSIPAH